MIDSENPLDRLEAYSSNLKGIVERRQVLDPSDESAVELEKEMYYAVQGCEEEFGLFNRWHSFYGMEREAFVKRGEDLVTQLRENVLDCLSNSNHEHTQLYVKQVNGAITLVEGLCNGESVEDLITV